MQILFAFSLSKLIEDIGLYAGLAAIPAVAALTLLYFAKAREVRSLRTWAEEMTERMNLLERRLSRPPEFAPRATAGPRTVPAPVATPPQTPAGANGDEEAQQDLQDSEKTLIRPPITAAATAAPIGSAGTTTVEQSQATGEQNGVAPGPPSSADTAEGPSVESVPLDQTKEAPLSEGAVQLADEAGIEGASSPGREAKRAMPHPRTVAATRSARPQARPTPQRRTQQPAALRASRPSRDLEVSVPKDKDPRGEISRRSAFLTLIGLVVVGALLILVATQLFGGDEKTPQSNRVSSNDGSGVNSQGSNSGDSSKSPPIARGSVTVAVLNGTTALGLAAQVADELEASGFRKGTVTNNPDQQLTSTVVFYRDGQKRAAQQVAKILKVGQVQAVSSDTQAVAGSKAQVVVVVGSDRTQ